MLSAQQGISYYWIGFSQSLQGDILEIGCWQGRSTLFLAQACQDSDNGIVHAVDHFRGNPGKTKAYVVGRRDLSDLEDNFRRNISEAGLNSFVKVYPVPSSQASISADIRLVVIDAEHTRDAVLHDWSVFRHLLIPGAVAIFDDYSSRDFPGVVQAVNEIHAAERGSRLAVHGRMASIILPV